MPKKMPKWYRGTKRPTVPNGTVPVGTERSEVKRPKRNKGAPDLSRIFMAGSKNPLPSKSMGRIFSEKKMETEEIEEIFPTIPPSKRTRIRGE